MNIPECFKFKTSADSEAADRALAALVSGRDPLSGGRPLIVIIGPARSGRSTVARLLLHKAAGYKDIASTGGQMRQELNVAAGEGLPYLLFDDLTPLETEASAMLARFMTCSHWRILHRKPKKPTEFTPKTAVVITTEKLWLNQDLQRRAIVIEMGDPTGGVSAVRQDQMMDLRLCQLATLAETWRRLATTPYVPPRGN